MTRRIVPSIACMLALALSGGAQAALSSPVSLPAQVELSFDLSKLPLLILQADFTPTGGATRRGDTWIAALDVAAGPSFSAADAAGFTWHDGVDPPDALYVVSNLNVDLDRQLVLGDVAVPSRGLTVSQATLLHLRDDGVAGSLTLVASGQCGLFGSGINALAVLCPAPFPGQILPTLGTLQVTAVPEPASWLLVGGGLAAAGAWRRRR